MAESKATSAGSRRVPPTLAAGPATPVAPVGATAAAAAALSPFASDLGGVLSGMFERARPNLTDGDLLAMGEQSRGALRLMRQMSELCNGLGALVGNDDSQAAVPVGCFQTGDGLAQLLSLLGATADHAAALSWLAAQAEQEKFHRELEAVSGAA